MNFFRFAEFEDDELFAYDEKQLKEDKKDLRAIVRDLKQDIDIIKNEELRYEKLQELREIWKDIRESQDEVDIYDIRERLNEMLDYIEQAEDTPFFTGFAFPDREPTGPVEHPGGGLHLQDMSTQVLMNAVQAGYTHAIWNLHELHPEIDVCDTLHGKVFKLEDLVLGLKHNAPIFEQSHPNCICWLLVYSEYDADLKWIIIDAIGPEGPVFA